MFRMICILWCFACWLIGLPALEAQVAPTLDELLEAATAHAPTLAELRAQRRVAAARLAEARKVFRPNVGVGGTYTLAAGGRSINLPLGDLLNPAYGALNQLTQSNQFPVLENAEEQFLPNNFYDARVRVQQPLFDPALQLSKRRAQAGIAASEAGIAVGTADLHEAVRTAYYQVLQARAAAEILASADSLVEEALRTTRSLIANGAGLPLARERILAERADVRAQRAVARLQVENALARLGTLVGRPVMEVASPAAPPAAIAQLLPDRRAELRQLRAAEQLVEVEAELERRFRRPRLGAQLDAGSQAFDFALEPYVSVGLSLDVPLYDGGRHRDRTDRLEAESAAAAARTRRAEEGVALQQTVARNQLLAARQRYEAFAPAVRAARRTLRDATLLYRNGATGYLELVDARTQLTRLRLQRNLAYYDIYLRRAALLRAYGQ